MSVEKVIGYCFFVLLDVAVVEILILRIAFMLSVRWVGFGIGFIFVEFVGVFSISILFFVFFRRTFWFFRYVNIVYFVG